MNEKADFIKMYAEIEFNATEDTLFERITLKRLRDYSDKHFGTTLNNDVLEECEELGQWLDKGKSERDWRVKIGQKRIASLNVTERMPEKTP